MTIDLPSISSLLLTEAAKPNCDDGWHRWSWVNGGCLERVAESLGCRPQEIGALGRMALDRMVVHGILLTNDGYVKVTDLGLSILASA